MTSDSSFRPVVGRLAMLGLLPSTAPCRTPSIFNPLQLPIQPCNMSPQLNLRMSEYQRLSRNTARHLLKSHRSSCSCKLLTLLLQVHMLHASKKSKSMIRIWFIVARLQHLSAASCLMPLKRKRGRSQLRTKFQVKNLLTKRLYPIFNPARTSLNERTLKCSLSSKLRKKAFQGLSSLTAS